MTHDVNGTEIKEGDEVIVRCRVKNVASTEGAGYCNATLETVEPMFPTDQPSTIVLNAKQVQRVPATPDEAG